MKGCEGACLSTPWLLAEIDDLVDSEGLGILVGCDVLGMKAPTVEDDESIGFHLNELK